IVAVVTIPVRLLARRNTWDPRLLGRIRRPFRVLAIAVAVWIAVATAFPTELADWRGTVDHAQLIVVIAASGWLLAGRVGFLCAGRPARFRIDVADSLVARRIHAQASLLRRVVAGVIAIITIGAFLLTFSGVEAVGASLLASAGFASVVAGLAVQSTL